jgi:hypothetical protein
MRERKYLLEEFHWALTPSALLVLDDLESLGIDRDLALLMLEKCWPESKVYHLPEGEEAENE